MFVCVARVTLQIPESGSLKAKRQVLRRVSDRVKARFNVSVAEVGDLERWQRAVLALCVVGNESRHVNEQMDKILDFIEHLYVAPVVDRELEIISFGDQLYGPQETNNAEAAIDRHLSLKLPGSERSLAEAEGLAAWDERQAPAKPVKGGALTIEEARARARSLRNRRDWEKP